VVLDVLKNCNSFKQFQKLLGPETWILRHKGTFYLSFLGWGYVLLKVLGSS
jgi:hypothetical protein